MLLLEDRRFYVYVYLDPRKPGNFNYDVNGEIVHFDFEPFYVGKGCGRRMYDHLNQRISSNRNKSSVIEEIKRLPDIDPYEIVFKFKSYLTEVEAYILEEKMIFAIGRIDKNNGPLTNRNDGGYGIKGIVHTREFRDACRQRQLGKSPGNKGKKAPDWVVEKNRNAHKGIFPSQDTLIKRSLSLKGKNKGKEKMTDGFIIKMVSKTEVDAYLKQGWIFAVEKLKDIYKGRITVFSKELNKVCKVYPNELSLFLEQGWVLGRGKALKCITKDGENKRVEEHLLKDYFDQGWVLGKGNV